MRSARSVGLVVTECIAISEDAVGYHGAPGIFTDGHVTGWKAVTDAVHAAGGKIYLQLWHTGRVSHASVRGGRPPSAPSAIAAPGQTRGLEGRVDMETPREMSAADIAQTIDDFGRAAIRAIEAGADGVELHGGFGYLDRQLSAGKRQHANRSLRRFDREPRAFRHRGRRGCAAAAGAGSRRRAPWPFDESEWHA